MGTIRVALISDIHWRGALSRHAEYRKTFEAFYESCVKNQVTHIFVGGDIVHAKTQGISPELIDMLNWWFTSMAKIAEVHVILGNHDANLCNASRQDAISPIIRALDNPRIFLHKFSGVYPFAEGYNFCVYSLIDPENWDKVQPVPGEFNIACYHGPVYGAVTETDWDVEGEMKVEFFKEKSYDCVLLGDIHKFQYLDYTDVELEINETDLLKYPGAEILERLET